MGNRIYGCDDCLAVCPWNKFAQAGREAKLAARDELRAPALAELARLDDAAFRALFAKIAGQAHRPRPLHPQCADRDRQLRRCGALAVEAERLLDDASPLVRGAAVWALSQLMGREAFERAAQRALGHETDESVRDEWRRAAESRLVECRRDSKRGIQYSRPVRRMRRHVPGS